MRSSPQARWIPVALLGVVSLFAMGANGECGPETGEGPGLDQEPECQVAADCQTFQAPADCQGGWSCDAGACNWFCDGDTACTVDADCGDGTCVDGACQSVAPEDPDNPEDPEEPKACATHMDCPDGLQCVQGVCTDDGEPKTCMATGCSGEICASGPVDSPCVAAPWHECLKYTACGPNGAGGSCAWAQTEAFEECMAQYEEPEPPACQTDSDCPVGQRCACMPDPSCPMCDVCLMQCVPDEEPTECHSDEDCGPDMKCELEPCPPCPCEDDGCACGACYPQGECVPQEPTGCTSDADCGPGEVCDLAPCPPCDCPADAENCVCEPCEPIGACVPGEPPTECKESGCSGEVCASGTVYTDCEYEPWFECLQHTECGAFAEGGGCGWAQTDAFAECMKKYEEPSEYCSSDADCPAGYTCQCDFSDYDSGGDPAMPTCPTKCVPEDNPPEGECKSDADCASGEICEIDYCVDCDCAEGDPGCEGCGCFGTCQPQQPPSEACWSDADCGDGMTCNKEDFCLPTPGCWTDARAPGAPCTDASGVNFGSCAMVLGWGVVDGQCTLLSGCDDQGFDLFANEEECQQTCVATDPCEPVCYGQCEPQDPTGGECISDADCPDDAYCEIQMCPDCMPSDDPDYSCPPCTGICKAETDPTEPTACMGDSDCGDGMVCDTSVCLPPPGCEPGEACPDVCYGQCVPAPPEQGCTTNADCPEGTYCEIQVCASCACPDGSNDCGCGDDPACWGVCEEKAPDPTQCLADDDCPEGQVCLSQPCPMAPCTPDYCPPCYGVCGEPDEPEPEPEPTECMATGCSGTVCAAEPVYTTCEFMPWYACYEYAQCGLTADGTCGWSKTDAFEECMAQFAP
ncbi:MAG: hypothetical protein ACQEXJ_03810 [Myxococcota bacterium]